MPGTRGAGLAFAATSFGVEQRAQVFKAIGGDQAGGD